ncbi:hypothetical protein KZ829_36475 [Actinoplanes hulinensis]|uniref:Uncharacterized protein n=1 Tax=Actinoplanes hulinensis TaxID=1144547 RepID=A0ABS7BEE1_9ACTN|nr:hypothetical protein [Actinoplanes hulinensis]MBW6439233.1 hypothetical protein [Actinoplanes hulinensis]
MSMKKDGMIIRLHFAIGVRKNSFMRQGSLFSRAHIAEMRNPAKARNHSPEREEFRRAQQRRRVFGLERRHAEKLRRLRRDVAAAPAPTNPGHPAAPAVPAVPSAAPAVPSAVPTVPPVVAAPRDTACRTVCTEQPETARRNRVPPHDRNNAAQVAQVAQVAHAAQTARAQDAVPREPADAPDSDSVCTGQATGRGIAATPAGGVGSPASPARRHRNPRHRVRGLQRRCCALPESRPHHGSPAADSPEPQTGNSMPGAAIEAARRPTVRGGIVTNEPDQHPITGSVAPRAPPLSHSPQPNHGKERKNHRIQPVSDQLFNGPAKPGDVRKKSLATRLVGDWRSATLCAHIGTTKRGWNTRPRLVTAAPAGGRSTAETDLSW